MKVRLTVVRVAMITALLMVARAADATEWFVAPGGIGNGTSGAPFGRIQQGLNAAQPGDVVTVQPGTYPESLRSVRHGTVGKPIRLRAQGSRGSVVVTVRGRVLTLHHANLVVEGLVLDGQYGAADAVRVSNGGHRAVLRNLEIRRSKHDLVNLEGPSDVLIEHCLLHRALNATDGRTDAHGVAAGAVQGLTIRHSEIHTFSGDGIQVDPDRASPGWKDVFLEDVRIWLQPLVDAENGFSAGVVPGENALDTKAAGKLPRATITVRNVTAWGFRGGVSSNMAAFNLKEHISATLDGVTVYDSEIAFRLRGGGATANGAWVTLKNAVVHGVRTAYRYEENVQNLRIWNNTIGSEVHRVFDAAASSRAGVDVRNLLVLGSRPPEAADPSNLAVQPTAFVNASQHDYRLSPGSAAIDAGARISEVVIDRNGITRPVGSAPDVGAYEWAPRQPADAHASCQALPFVQAGREREPDRVGNLWLSLRLTGLDDVPKGLPRGTRRRLKSTRPATLLLR